MQVLLGQFDRGQQKAGQVKYTLDPSLVSSRNPTGIKLSQEAIDESARSSYWLHAIEYGLQYYVAGRFAVAASFTPVCATLLHHAVELMLKACLAYADPIETIRAYGRRDSYGHSLESLWREFRCRNTDLDLTAFDDVVTRLDAFESIRYPESLIAKGAILHVGMYEVEQPTTPPGAPAMPEPTYTLMLPQIDRLVGLLLQHTDVNLHALQSRFWPEHAVAYLRLGNATEFPGLTPDRVSEASASAAPVLTDASRATDRILIRKILTCALAVIKQVVVAAGSRIQSLKVLLRERLTRR